MRWPTFEGARLAPLVTLLRWRETLASPRTLAERRAAAEIVRRLDEEREASPIRYARAARRAREEARRAA